MKCEKLNNEMALVETFRYCILMKIKLIKIINSNILSKLILPTIVHFRLHTG